MKVSVIVDSQQESRRELTGRSNGKRMAEDHNNSEGVAQNKPESRRNEGAGPEVNFLPPMDVTIDIPEFRFAKLRRVVAEHVVPRLLALHEQVANENEPQLLPESADIDELTKLVLGPDNSDAFDFILRLKARGISLDNLHTALLEPTARHLGELWDLDRIDFVDVTLGVARLQRLVHVFEGLDQVPNYDEKRHVLLATAPGEQHSLGTTIVQKFLRAAGWHVATCATPRMEDAADLAAHEWFGVIGFSLSSDLHRDGLAEAIARVRKMSLNPKVGIMVGGSAISRHPEWVEQVGADGTAVNGPTAVILAKKLLAAGLA
jgi:MerR family transcriptional regulator, light-induced transcriptional regulator